MEKHDQNSIFSVWGNPDRNGTFAELLLATERSSVIELGCSIDFIDECWNLRSVRDRVLELTNPKQIFLRGEEFFFKNGKEEVSLGIHKFSPELYGVGGWIGWNIDTPRLYIGRRAVSDDGRRPVAEYWKVQSDGSGTLVYSRPAEGIYDWYVGPTGICLNWYGDLQHIGEDGTKRNLGKHNTHDPDNYYVGPPGFMAVRGKNFKEVCRISIKGEEVVLTDKLPIFDHYWIADYGLILVNKSNGLVYYYIIK